EVRINGDPPLPQSMTIFSGGCACTHRARILAGEPDDRIGSCFEVEPPRRMSLVPAVHGERDEVPAVLDVTDDDAPLLPGLPTDGRETQRTPAALVRRRPKDATAADSIDH